MAEPTPNLWPQLYRGRVRAQTRLQKAIKLLRLSMSGHIVDKASPLIYSSIVLLDKALAIQLATEGLGWKPESRPPTARGQE